MGSKRIGLLLPVSTEYHRAIMRELRRAAPSVWDLVLVPAWERRSGWLDCWGLDAVVYSQDTPALAAAVDALGVPGVNLSYFRTSGCTVLPDNQHAGRMAARLLADAGCVALAYCPMPSQLFSLGRARGLRDEARRLGLPVRPDAPAEPRPRQAWLRALPECCGVLAANDLLALTLLGELRLLGIPVPERVRVCGVDDDACAAALAEPALSSIPLPIAGVATAIVVALEQSFAGIAPAREAVLVPFLPPVLRASTGGSDGLDRAYTAMLAGLGGRLAVSELAAAAAMPRRTFETRWRARHGCSPLASLNRLRVARAEELLRSGGDLAGVAQACGLASPARLIRTFRTIHGMTPGRWLRRT